jgi:type III pantothenate kinase
MTAFPLVAVDVGNNRIKCGFFPAHTADVLPEPEATLAVAITGDDLDRIDTLIQRRRTQEPVAWWIGSVNRPAATRLIEWIRSRRPCDAVRLVASGDLPLRVALPRPDMVGIDRLLDAVAANQLRSPGHAAVVVDVGSAITVDFVSEEGTFLGGSILPGIAMSARALHTFTDLLPLIEMSELTVPPPALGTATESAMRSGLFWGAVGAIRQLIAEMAKGKLDRTDVFLTGGAGPAVAALLDPGARHVPHLTLSGIAVAARSSTAT